MNLGAKIMLTAGPTFRDFPEASVSRPSLRHPHITSGSLSRQTHPQQVWAMTGTARRGDVSFLRMFTAAVQEKSFYGQSSSRHARFKRLLLPTDSTSYTSFRAFSSEPEKVNATDAPSDASRRTMPAPAGVDTAIFAVTLSTGASGRQTRGRTTSP
jgi:hypothetical protein